MKNKMYHGFYKNMKQLNCFLTLLIIINVCCAANQHIRMISEGSCDTEDWSNDAKNSALITGINYILQYIQIEDSILNCKNVSQYYWFYYILNQMNLGEHKWLLPKTLKCPYYGFLKMSLHAVCKHSSKWMKTSCTVLNLKEHRV